MLFNHKFPGAKIGVIQKYDGHSVSYQRVSKTCTVCGQLTHWMNMNIVGWCCSEECKGNMSLKRVLTQRGLV